MWEFYVAILVYALTIQFGVAGNSWVICSVVRNRRPYNSIIRRSPSDRLRTYIVSLAIVDSAVIVTLLVRLLYFCLQKTVVENVTCQVIYFTEHFAKLASLACLACISAERFIAIRKPFDSQVRKYLFKLTPYAAFCVLLVIVVAMTMQVTTVRTTADRLDCQLSLKLNIESILPKIFITSIFISLIIFVSVNYGQIIRHVRRKFWKRKARVCMDSHGQQRVIAEPRYMKEMTSAIMRVAIFHIVCWLPFCILQLFPNDVSTLTAASIRLFKKDEESRATFLRCAAFIANWLVYANSASNWIFYAVMNRDLRTLIRRNTERRKRSNMSQPSQSAGKAGNSFRKNFTSSLRFLHSGSTKSQSSGLDDNAPLHLTVPSTLKNQMSQRKRYPSECDLKTELFGKLLTTPQPRSAISSQRNSLIGTENLLSIA